MPLGTAGGRQILVPWPLPTRRHLALRRMLSLLLALCRWSVTLIAQLVHAHVLICNAILNILQVHMVYNQLLGAADSDMYVTTRHAACYMTHTLSQHNGHLLALSHCRRLCQHSQPTYVPPLQHCVMFTACIHHYCILIVVLQTSIMYKKWGMFRYVRPRREQCSTHSTYTPREL